MSNYLLKVADVTGRQRVHFLQNLHNFVSYTSFRHNIIKLYEGKVNLWIAECNWFTFLYDVSVTSKHPATNTHKNYVIYPRICTVKV